MFVSDPKKPVGGHVVGVYNWCLVCENSLRASLLCARAYKLPVHPSGCQVTHAGPIMCLWNPSASAAQARAALNPDSNTHPTLVPEMDVPGVPWGSGDSNSSQGPIPIFRTVNITEHVTSS